VYLKSCRLGKIFIKKIQLDLRRIRNLSPLK